MLLKKWRCWRTRHLLARCDHYDRTLYLQHSGTVSPDSCKESFRAWLTLQYHGIERALALPAPRPGFGGPVVQQLVTNLEKYVDQFGPDSLAVTVLNVLYAYDEFNQGHGIENERLLERLRRLKARIPEECDQSQKGGVLSLSRNEIQEAGQRPFGEFVQRRHSIRNYTDAPVPFELITRAVQIAVKTPSVCNRQGWRVHCYLGKSACGRILAHQRGNRGFGDTCHAVLVVTCDLRTFFGVNERHAAFIDGGMFAMSLIYALHSLGLGSCCLNLSLMPHQELALRQTAGIGEHEALIVMITVGQLPEKLWVTQSPRKPVGDILVHHDMEEGDAAVFRGPLDDGSAARCGEIDADTC